MRVASWSAVIAADPLLDSVGVLLQVRGAALPPARRGRAPSPRVALGGSRRRSIDDDMGELGQLGPLLARLGELRRVLGDEHPAVGVGEDERRLLGVGLRVDRGGRARPRTSCRGRRGSTRPGSRRRARPAAPAARRARSGRRRWRRPARRPAPQLSDFQSSGPSPEAGAPGSGRPRRPAWPPRARGRESPRRADGSRSGSVCRSRHPPGPAAVDCAAGSLRLLFNSRVTIEP